MTIRSARRDAQEKAREKLTRQRVLTFSSALFGSAIPFMPAPLVIAMGVAAAHLCLGIEKKMAENEKPIVWDSLLEVKRLCPIAICAEAPTSVRSCPTRSGRLASRMCATTKAL